MKTKGKAAYREFLRSAFWVALSERKRSSVGKCERCGETRGLQSHHVRYPADWAHTTSEDLMVLCRHCHRREHGFFGEAFMIYRDDLRFSRLLFRIWKIRKRVLSGMGIRRREVRLLVLSWKEYPPTKKDSCMAFHVRTTFLLQEKMQEWARGSSSN